MKELYDHQKVAVEDLRAGIRDGHKLQVLAASTGFGKSIVAMHLIHSSMKKGKRCLFLVDRRVLVDQFSQHLADNGIDHGVLMAKHWRWRPNKSVQVASVQTMERMETWPVFDLVVIDEVHAVMRDSVCAMLAKTSAVVVGLTATPFHHRLAQHFSRISNTITMAELVKMGALVPFKVFASREIDVSGLKAQGDSWEKEKLQSRALQVVGDVVSDYATLSAQVFGGPRKTIVFSSGVEHGKELARRFQEAGHNFISISYKDDEDHKKSILEEFARPDTTLQGIISTDILTRGFDQTDVEHVILAQPLRKSFSKFVQMIGRGARKHDGKEFCLIQDNCVASGSKILTHRGLVPVELILLSDKIWDGHDFVQHRGAISRGKKPVITYAGLTATRDHRVKTATAWRTFGECSDEQTPIVTTGIGGAKVFERSNYFSTSSSTWQEGATVPACFGGVRKLWLSLNNFLLKSHERRIQGVPPVQPNGQAHPSLPELAFCTGYVNEDPMREGNARQLRKLRRTWDSLRVRFSKSRGNLDIGELGDTRGLQKSGAGQDRQQRALRSGQFAMGQSDAEHGQSTKFSVDPKHAQVHAGKPTSQIRSYYAQITSFCRDVFRGHRESVQQAEPQTEREVWDILDCGPRNSFTCEGLLVHNCGNWLRFQSDWESLFHGGVHALPEGPDDKNRKERTEKEKEASCCPKCKQVWSAGAEVCSFCGHARERRSDVAEVAGVMQEVTGAQVERFDGATKERWFQELLKYARHHGYKDGWAFFAYQDKFGIKPSWKKTCAPSISPDVAGWITHRNIRRQHAARR